MKQHLKVLFALVHPCDRPAIDQEFVWERFRLSFGEPAPESIVLSCVIEPTQGHLETTLAQDRWDVLHLITQTDDHEGVYCSISLLSADKRCRYIPVHQFAQIVAKCSGLRLVVLQSSEGAKISAAAADGLVEHGVKGVVCLPGLRGGVATKMLRMFYGELLAGGNLNHVQRVFDRHLPECDAEKSFDEVRIRGTDTDSAVLTAEQFTEPPTISVHPPRETEGGQMKQDPKAESATTLKDFFISYSTYDKEWARWIAWKLEEAHFSVVLQDWDFRPGENLVLRMDEAAKQTRSTIAILSPAYLNSRFTQPEWAAAFARDPKGREKRLIPVRVGDCDLDGLLRQIIYINLVGLGEQEAKMALLGGLEGRGKPLNAPLFPDPVQFPGPAAARDSSSASELSIAAGVVAVSKVENTNKSLRVEERLELIQTLNAVPVETFNTLVFVLSPPAGLIAPMPAPQGQRSSQLLAWAESPGGCTLRSVEQLMGRLLHSHIEQ